MVGGGGAVGRAGDGAGVRRGGIQLQTNGYDNYVVGACRLRCDRRFLTIVLPLHRLGELLHYTL